MYNTILQIKTNFIKNLPRVANLITEEIKMPCSIIFEGDLGSGKTTLIRSLASSLRIDSFKISSPTFSIVNEYNGKLKLKKIRFNHFDLYRLEDSNELIELPFDYFFKFYYLNCFEWGLKFLPSIYEYSERLYLLRINRDFSKQNEEYRIFNLSLIDKINY